jgi:hypothetical protein
VPAPRSTEIARFLSLLWRGWQSDVFGYVPMPPVTQATQCQERWGDDATQDVLSETDPDVPHERGYWDDWNFGSVRHHTKLSYMYPLTCNLYLDLSSQIASDHAADVRVAIRRYRYVELMLYLTQHAAVILFIFKKSYITLGVHCVDIDGWLWSSFRVHTLRENSEWFSSLFFFSCVFHFSLELIKACEQRCCSQIHSV